MPLLYRILMRFANGEQQLRFFSTASMERGLDGNEERFGKYFFAIYHCSPDEREPPGGIVERREQLRRQFPDKVIAIGKRFVLTGDAAWTALAGYYQALVVAETLGDDFRAYAKERLDAITIEHRQSQSLPVPIDLTEGQLANDPRLELLTCIALRNGQVMIAEPNR
jgi:hypothetical protein